MKRAKRKDLTESLAAQVKSTRRIDTLKRIFALKFKTIIPPSGASVKALSEFYEENYEVFVAMEKWKRILMCALLALCVTIGVLSLCGIVNMFMGAV